MGIFDVCIGSVYVIVLIVLLMNTTITILGFKYAEGNYNKLIIALLLSNLTIFFGLILVIFLTSGICGI